MLRYGYDRRVATGVIAASERWRRSSRRRWC
jgi:TRAP-type mannitol/chloroaromatic compound transport system permease large subunit